MWLVRAPSRHVPSPPDPPVFGLWQALSLSSLCLPLQISKGPRPLQVSLYRSEIICTMAFSTPLWGCQ